MFCGECGIEIVHYMAYFRVSETEGYCMDFTAGRECWQKRLERKVKIKNIKIDIKEVENAEDMYEVTFNNELTLRGKKTNLIDEWLFTEIISKEPLKKLRELGFEYFFTKETKKSEVKDILLKI